MQKTIFTILGFLFIYTLSGYAESTIVITQEPTKAEVLKQKERYLSLVSLPEVGEISIEIVPLDGFYLLKVRPFKENDLLAVHYLKTKQYYPEAFILKEESPIKPLISPKTKVIEKRVVVTREVPVKQEDTTLWIALFGLALIGVLYMFLSSDQIRRLNASHKTMKEKYKVLEEKQHNVLSSMGENIHTIAKETIDQTSKLVEKSKETELHDEIKQVMYNENEILSRTGDLIKFLQLKSKKIVLMKEIFNFDNMLHEVIGLLSESAKVHQTNLIVDIDTNVPNVMRTDSSHLSQILLNLLEYYVQNVLGNKVKMTVIAKYSVKKGRELKINITGNLRIKDKTSFFDTYYDDMSQRYVGLGMFVARELIDLMGGEILIHKETQSDSLEIFLPIEEAVKDKRKYRLSQKKIMDSRVLIIENDLDSALALQKRLTYFRMAAQIEDMAYLLQQITQLEQYDILMIERETFETLSHTQLQSISEYLQLKIVVTENLYKKYTESLPSLVDSILCKPFSPEYVYEVIDGLYLPEKKSIQKNETVVGNGIAVHREPFNDIENLTLEMFNTFANRGVLIVEDNVINQKVVQGILSKSQMDIMVANNGEEALEQLEKHGKRIAFILMDINMPVMDGFVATEKIRHEKRFDHIPIVSLTALVAEHEIEKIFDVGMNGYLSKPIKVEKLYTAMHFFLGDARPIKSSLPHKSSEPIQLKGLNLEEGLLRMQHNSVFYKEVLREFIDAYAKSDLLYARLVHQKRYSQAKILSLDMRGLTETIGAKELHVLMNEIYKTISVYNKPHLLDRYIDPYKKELKTLKESIEIYLNMDT